MMSSHQLHDRQHPLPPSLHRHHRVGLTASSSTTRLLLITASCLTLPHLVSGQFYFTSLSSPPTSPDFSQFLTIFPLLFFFLTFPVYLLSIFLLYRRRKHYPIAGRGSSYLLIVNTIFICSSVVQNALAIAYPLGVPCALHYIQLFAFTVPLCFSFLLRAWILTFRLEIMNYLSETRWREEKRMLVKQEKEKEKEEEKERKKEMMLMTVAAGGAGESPTSPVEEDVAAAVTRIHIGSSSDDTMTSSSSHSSSSHSSSSTDDLIDPTTIPGAWFIAHRRYTDPEFIRRQVGCVSVGIFIAVTLMSIFDPDSTIDTYFFRKRDLMTHDQSFSPQFSSVHAFFHGIPCGGYSVKILLFMVMFNTVALPLGAWVVWRMSIDAKRRKVREEEQAKLKGSDATNSSPRSSAQQSLLTKTLARAGGVEHDDSTNVKHELFVVVSIGSAGVGGYYLTTLFYTPLSGMVEPLTFLFVHLISIIAPLRMSYAISRKHREMIQQSRMKHASNASNGSMGSALKGSKYRESVDAYNRLPHQRPYYSLKYIIQNMDTYPVLLAFLQKEYSSENLLFLKATRAFGLAARNLELIIPTWPRSNDEEVGSHKPGHGVFDKTIMHERTRGGGGNNTSVLQNSLVRDGDNGGGPGEGSILGGVGTYAAEKEKEKDQRQKESAMLKSTPQPLNVILDAPPQQQQPNTNNTNAKGKKQAFTQSPGVASNTNNNNNNAKRALLVPGSDSSPNQQQKQRRLSVSDETIPGTGASSTTKGLSVPNSTHHEHRASLIVPVQGGHKRTSSKDSNGNGNGNRNGKTPPPSPPLPPLLSPAPPSLSPQDAERLATQTALFHELHSEAQHLKQWANSIYTDYLARSAMYEINVAEDLNKLALSQLSQLSSWDPTPIVYGTADESDYPIAPPFPLSTLYKQTYMAVFQLIHKDPFRRFILTPAFAGLIAKADDLELNRLEKQSELEVETANVIDHAMEQLGVNLPASLRGKNNEQELNGNGNGGNGNGTKISPTQTAAGGGAGGGSGGATSKVVTMTHHAAGDSQYLATGTAAAPGPSFTTITTAGTTQAVAQLSQSPPQPSRPPQQFTQQQFDSLQQQTQQQYPLRRPFGGGLPRIPSRSRSRERSQNLRIQVTEKSALRAMEEASRVERSRSVDYSSATTPTAPPSADGTPIPLMTKARAKSVLMRSPKNKMNSSILQQHVNSSDEPMPNMTLSALSTSSSSSAAAGPTPRLPGIVMIESPLATHLRVKRGSRSRTNNPSSF